MSRLTRLRIDATPRRELRRSFPRATPRLRPAADYAASVARSRSHQSLGSRCRLIDGTMTSSPSSVGGSAARRPDASREAGRSRRSRPGAKGRSRPPEARPPAWPARWVGKVVQAVAGQDQRGAADGHRRNIISDRRLRRKSAEPAQPQPSPSRRIVRQSSPAIRTGRLCAGPCYPIAKARVE